MSEIRVPLWFQDSDEIGHCPCGHPPRDGIMVVEGDAKLSRWLHRECLDWLEHEMTDEEIEEMQEWKRRNEGQ